uniref:Programmed cell death protein 2 n=1 Tax=Neovison vison TaxID=452646 RepID=A0A8C7A7E1_NEOVI
APVWGGSDTRSRKGGNADATLLQSDPWKQKRRGRGSTRSRRGRPGPPRGSPARRGGRPRRSRDGLRSDMRGCPIGDTDIPPPPLSVFRNQLPRKNDFYSYEPPSEDPPAETGDRVRLQLPSGAHLCRVCGCLGPKTCSRCHKAHYCSREHQTLDWRSGHKQACTQSDYLDRTIPDHNFLFPEFEIVIETEDEITPEVVEKENESEILGSMGEALEEELDSMAKHESKEDKIFQKFKTKIAHEPEQVLRYGRGIAPVWISGENIPQEKDIPNCPCGAKRIFEFQV